MKSVGTTLPTMSFIPQPINIYAPTAAQFAQTNALPVTVNNNAVTALPHTPQPTTPSYMHTQQQQSNSISKSAAFSEYLDKIKEQYSLLENKNNSLKAEIEKVQAEKSELQKQMVMYYEMCYGLNVDLHRSNEIAKRMTSVCNQMITHLPLDIQQQFNFSVERAKQVSVTDLSTIISQQMAQFHGGSFLPAALASAPTSIQTLRLPNSNSNSVTIPTATLPTGAAGHFPLIPPPNLFAHHNHTLLNIKTEPNIKQEDQTSFPHTVMPRSSILPQKSNPGGFSNSRGVKEVNLMETNRSKKAKGDSSDDENEGDLVVDDDEPHANEFKLMSTKQTKSNMPNILTYNKVGLASPDSTQTSSVHSTAFTSKSQQMMTLNLPSNISNIDTPTHSLFHKNFNSTPESMHMSPINKSAFTTHPSKIDGLKSKYLLTNSVQHHLKSKSSFYKSNELQNLSPELIVTGEYPNNIIERKEFIHDDVVCTVCYDSANSRLLTGGKGTIKVWSLDGSTSNSIPIKTLQCEEDTYLRFCKLLPEKSTIVAGGELNSIYLFDLESDLTTPKEKLTSNIPAYYSIALAADGKQWFTCGSNGIITVWDGNTYKIISHVEAHSEGASCIDISSDGNTIYTGGLDKCVKSWDIRNLSKNLKEYFFSSQIFAISACPKGDWISVGTEDALVEIQHLTRDEKYLLKLHTQSILTLKTSHNGKWCVTGGKDSLFEGWTCPKGASLFGIKESSSVLSCEISPDDKWIVTGSGDKKATLYELIYL